MTHPIDMIDVGDGGSGGGQTDRTIATTGVRGGTVCVRRWHITDDQQCWLIVKAGNDKIAMSVTRDQLRALGLACMQAATGDGRESPS